MMRGTRTWDENVFEAAKAAAPYLHPRLNATNVTADVTTTWEEAVSQVFYDGSFAGNQAEEETLN